MSLISTLFSLIAIDEPAVAIDDTALFDTAFGYEDDTQPTPALVLITTPLTAMPPLDEQQLIGQLVEYRHFDSDNELVVGRVTEVKSTRFGMEYRIEPTNHYLPKWRKLEDIISWAAYVPAGAS